MFTINCRVPFYPGFENKNYSPDYKDQSWIVYCCPIVETLVDCKNSGFVNKFYKDAYFDIPQGYYLHGVESVHDYKSHLDDLHTSTTYQYERYPSRNVFRFMQEIRSKRYEVFKIIAIKTKTIILNFIS